ncbi:MAG: hypothetical protein GX792_09060 [Bacteroidales bacterium]|nr:hypothetical protein [Bacteroidales bacterium]
MKIKFLAFAVITAMIFASCKDEIDEIGGDTDLENNKVGYTYNLKGTFAGANVGTGFKATVTENTGGVVEIKLEGKVVDKFASNFPSPHIGKNGNVSISGKFINSSDGVAYVNSKGEQTVLAKYNAKVGDKWSYTTLGGKKITREVKSVSKENDYYWGGMNIKVITIEQNLPYPGFKKAVYYANHRFGLVGVDITLEDGTVVYSAIL